MGARFAAHQWKVNPSFSHWKVGVWVVCEGVLYVGDYGISSWSRLWASHTHPRCQQSELGGAIFWKKVCFCFVTGLVWWNEAETGRAVWSSHRYFTRKRCSKRRKYMFTSELTTSPTVLSLSQTDIAKSQTNKARRKLMFWEQSLFHCWSLFYSWQQRNLQCKSTLSLMA